MGMAFRTTGFTLGNYEVGQTIGQGSSSKVKLGRHMETGELVALKIYSRGGLFLPQLKAEIAAFRAVRHPNVIRFLDILATSEKLYLVLEYASGGDLFSTIAALSGAMAEAQARKYFQQLISAVSYCHSQGVYHRDIKPENLLLDADGNLKLADFGLSACAEDKKNGLLYLRCGTNYYMAPEVIDSRGNNGVTPDLWSCGVVLFYMLAGRLPFTRDENDNQALFRKIKAGRYHMPKLSVGATYIVHRLLEPNPSKRMSCAILAQVEWFKLDYKRPQLVALHTADLAQYQSNLDEVLRTDFKSLKAIELQRVNPFRHVGVVLSAVIRAVPQDGTSKKVLLTLKRPVGTILDELETYAINELGMEVVKERNMLVMKEAPRAANCMLGCGRLTATAQVCELSPAITALMLHKTGGDTASHRIWEHLSREMQSICF